VPKEKYTYKPFPGAQGRVRNPDKSFSSERTVSSEVDKRHYVVPSLVFDEGKPRQLKGHEPIKRAMKMGLKEFPSFSSQKEANEYAAWRTKHKGTRTLEPLKLRDKAKKRK